MTKTCSVAACNTNHKKRINGTPVISHPGTVIKFPNKKNESLLPAWVKFCNRKHEFTITNNTGICTKHFDEKFINKGTRMTLKWELNPVPTKYAPDIDVPPSMIPTGGYDRWP